MVTRAPLRFLQLYFLRLGFLDGMVGFQICMHTAYYSFLKQAKLWELNYAQPQPDPEENGAASASEGAEQVLSLAEAADEVKAAVEPQPRRSAA
jgi:hypothetical protein